MIDILEIHDLHDITAGEKPVVIEYYANKCQHCHKFADKIEDMALRYQDQADFYKINIKHKDSNLEQALGCEVRGLPTTLAFRPDMVEVGSICQRLVGDVPAEELENWIDGVVKGCTQPTPSHIRKGENNYWDQASQKKAKRLSSNY